MTKRTVISVDIETDGPVPGEFSMLSVGMVVVSTGLHRRLYQEFRPVTDRFQPEAMAVNGLDREGLRGLPWNAEEAMMYVHGWLTAQMEIDGTDRCVFIGDNPGFDFAFINYYFHKYLGDTFENPNPFGWSARRIGDIWSGLKGNFHRVGDWKDLRVTEHDHNALADAMGNAEALLRMRDEHGLSW
jgi:DNA polymerase III epsilon subunit-like protein